MFTENLEKSRVEATRDCSSSLFSPHSPVIYRSRGRHLYPARWVLRDAGCRAGPLGTHGRTAAGRTHRGFFPTGAWSVMAGTQRGLTPTHRRDTAPAGSQTGSWGSRVDPPCRVHPKCLTRHKRSQSSVMWQEREFRWLQQVRSKVKQPTPPVCLSTQSLQPLGRSWL